MAVITPTPLKFDDYVLKIPTDDYAAACMSCTLVPKTTVTKLIGGKPTATFKDVDLDWTLDLEYAQDWAAAASLARKLWSAQGTTIPSVEFEPKTGAPGAVGGASRKSATSRVSLEVVGQPVFAAS